MRAERRAGEMLRDMEKAKGAKEKGTKRGTTRSPAATASAPKLSDIGVTKTQSSRWQKLADKPLDQPAICLPLNCTTLPACGVEQ
jgi:hypothetical protein